MKWLVWVLCAGAAAFGAEPATTTAPSVSAFKILNAVTLVDADELPVSTNRTDVYCIGDVAVAPGQNGRPVVFDLKNDTVTDERGAKYTLVELEKRADDQRETALKTLGDFMDPVLAERMKYTLRPNFKIAEQYGEITFTNALVDCSVRAEAVKEEFRTRVYKIGKMIAYRKATVDTPPYPNLAINEELEKRGTFVREMRIVVHQKSEPETLLIYSKVVPMSEEEVRKIGPEIERVSRH